MNPGYHHGALPDALRLATVELVAEKGPMGFSLREAARRAGVSHSAPKHHFGDARGLLTSVAIEGFDRLAVAFETAIDGETDPILQLEKVGKAYVTTALESPGHMRVMMQQEVLDSDNQELLESSLKAHSLLVETVERLAARENPGLDVNAASTLCWAAMHGLVELAPKLNHMAELLALPEVSLDETFDEFISLIFTGLLARD